MHEHFLSTHNKHYTSHHNDRHTTFPQHILYPYTSHPLHGWCHNTPCHMPTRRLVGYCVDVGSSHDTSFPSLAVRQSEGLIFTILTFILLNEIPQEACFPEVMAFDIVNFYIILHFRLMTQVYLLFHSALL
jgi:hypothetical protein